MTEELIVVPGAASTTSLAFAGVGGWAGSGDPPDVDAEPAGAEGAASAGASRLSRAVDELLAGLGPVPVEST